MKNIIKVIGLVFLTLGIILFLVGAFFKMHEWPDLFNGVITGFVFVAIGLFLLVIHIVIRNRKKQ